MCEAFCRAQKEGLSQILAMAVVCSCKLQLERVRGRKAAAFYHVAASRLRTRIDYLGETKEFFNFTVETTLKGNQVFYTHLWDTKQVKLQ